MSFLFWGVIIITVLIAIIITVLIAIIIVFYIGAYIGFITGWTTGLRNLPTEPIEVKPLVVLREGWPGLRIKIDEGKFIRLGDTNEDKPIRYQWPQPFTYEPPKSEIAAATEKTPLPPPIQFAESIGIVKRKTKPTEDAYDWAHEQRLKNGWTKRQAFNECQSKYPAHFKRFDEEDEAWDAFKKAMSRREKRGGTNLDGDSSP